MNYQQLLAPARQFLHRATPQTWIDEARRPENLALLLTDHMVCELKAAQTAMLLIRKYVADERSAQALLDGLKPYEDFTFRSGPEPDFAALHKQISKSAMPRTKALWEQALIDKMVPLIKEELHHFWQVREIMLARDIPYIKITASRYARGLLTQLRTWEPAALVDKLICGAYIEARSCERFAALAPYLDAQLEAFYLSLLRSEARHYQDYLALARLISPQQVDERISMIGAAEARLISTPDPLFRFHSGIPT